MLVLALCLVVFIVVATADRDKLVAGLLPAFTDPLLLIAIFLDFVYLPSAFSALTLLVERQEEKRPVEIE